MKINAKSFFPPLQWLPDYNFKTLGADAIAGLMLTAYAIPVSLAYATLAGLPPQYGIFGYLLGGFFYALLGTSRQLAIGPTSAISMVIGVTLATLSGGDPQRWLDLASLTGVALAAMSFLAYILRLDSIINFISETVLTGFKAGAALTIMLTQLPKLFGVSSGGTNFFGKLADLFHKLPETNYYVLVFGIIAFLLIFFGEKYFRGKPIAIYVVIISILLISLPSLSKHGFKTVGLIPSELPKFHIPKLVWADIQS
ncbi:MAG: SulP family inorganic anion transporter, partial [Bacteroidia bacterium]|nr:SulP family inorganic anion transporter [Bacteroidia bacterium]